MKINKVKQFIFSSVAVLALMGCESVETAPEDAEVGTEEVSDSLGEDVSSDSNESKDSKGSSEPDTEESEESNSDKVTTTDFGIEDGYTLISVDGGDQSGSRDTNVVVDIGFGDREYFAYTNEHGQLVKVTAKEIILQDDSKEEVTSSGRYYYDEAKVPGVESDKLDEGHVIADSLGGVSNAYNITPQESTLNRHGDQAYMEDAIRTAGGATDFVAIISYPDTDTQIPSHYEYTYTIKGNTVTDSFDNINPDEVNEELGLTGSKEEGNASEIPNGDLASVDANGNGKVTIQEAKDAGFSMPVTSDHWVYQYMSDADGDGKVGE